MATLLPPQAHKPRELRRRVVLPARLRTGVQWSDTCILNISSRGLLIHSSRPADRGALVEVCRGDHVIAARVIWRDGARVGLRSDDRLPVEQIVTLGHAGALQLTAGQTGERPSGRRRGTEDHRSDGRWLEFIGVGVIAASIALSLSAMAQHALSRPLAA